LNRLTVDSTGNVLGHLTVIHTRGQFDVYFGNGDPRFVAQVHFKIESEVETWLRRLRHEIHRKHFGAPATPVAAPQTAGLLDGAHAGQAEAGPQAPSSDDARHYHAVDTLFAALGAGQASL
jgi:hypothetical protein